MGMQLAPALTVIFFSAPNAVSSAFGRFSNWMALCAFFILAWTAAKTTLLNTITYVVSLRSKEEMVRIYARLVVAAVQNKKPISDGMAHKQHPRAPVSEYFRILATGIPSEVAVPHSSLVTLPYPAPIGWPMRNKAKESFDFCLHMANVSEWEKRVKRG